MLNSSKAIIGRNDNMFAINMSQVPQFLMNDNADLGRLFIERRLVVDHEGLFGVMSIVTEHFSDENILYCDIEKSLSSIKHKENDKYPFHEEVRNWFLEIPQFLEKDKEKYEGSYQKRKTKINELMHKYAGEFYKDICSKLVV